jgi:hypothetical protein
MTDNTKDIFGRKLEVGDEVGGQAWGHTGTVKRMTVKGFTEKKVRVMVHIPGYTNPTYGNTVPVPPREEMTHAFAHELVKTGVNHAA